MNGDNWDKIADEYSRKVGDRGDVYHRLYINPVLFKMVGKVNGKKVLDLGCGSGYISRILAKKGATVTGIDSSKVMISIAKEKETRGKLGIDYLMMDASNLKGLGSGSFDFVVSAMALHDIKDIKNTIRECGRVLKPKGKLIFSIVHPVREAGEIKKGAKGYHIEIRSYSRIRKLRSPLTFSKKVAIAAYHRPLGYYFKILSESGFVVFGFEEISDRHSHGKAITDKALFKFKSSFPSFLVMGCSKL